MNQIAITAGLVGLLGVLPLQAQPSAEVFLMRATATALQPHLERILKVPSIQRLTIAVDPIYFVNMGDGHTHEAIPADAAQALLRSLHGVLRPLSQVLIRDPNISGPPGYSLLNADAALVVGKPVIVGDTASVYVIIKTATGTARQPIYTEAREFTYLRRGSTWRRIGDELRMVT